jgi:hypothetical protein
MNKFSLGRVVATPGALRALAATGESAADFLTKHQQGDWGVVCKSDQQANEASLKDGSRILSAYLLKDGTKIWVLTEAVGDDGQRASTCILLPEEY